MTRTRALLALAVITAIGGALRFYNLGWGAPYFHFHMDEHYVFMGADHLRNSLREAALSGKFFMYGPLPMYLVNAVRWAYEAVADPLVLTNHRDGITYMVMGRAISAAFGTLTIPIAYAIGTRVAGRLAGLLAAACLALSVLLIRDSHFFSVDMSMTFFCMLTWLALLRMAERGTIRSAVATGVAFAAAITCKYTAVFMAIPIAVAYLLSPQRPTSFQPYGAWVRWALRGTVVPLTAVAAFVLLDPMVWLYWDKFLFDVRTQITDPLSGASRAPIFFAHFYDLEYPRLYFFTNLLWWGMGPVLEIAGLAGVVWLLARRTKPAVLSAIVPIAYFVVGGGTVAPFIRYAIPLAASLAVAAGVLCADLLTRPRWRLAGAIVTFVVLGTTVAWAAAYMNIFRQPDSRVAASRYLRQVLPAGAKVLVEPSHNIPPLGSYSYATNFFGDYVVWGPRQERLDFVQLYGLDTYVHLYRPFPQEEKRNYIASKLSQADWIVMDDTYLQWYDHLPESDYGAVKEYYRDLFAGRLGFQLDKTFKVYPSLFGYEINDDKSEFTFRYFDHPRIFIFRRTANQQ